MNRHTSLRPLALSSLLLAVGAPTQAVAADIGVRATANVRQLHGGVNYEPLQFQAGIVVNGER